jgi:hypothetical protein
VVCLDEHRCGWSHGRQETVAMGRGKYHESRGNVQGRGPSSKRPRQSGLSPTPETSTMTHILPPHADLSLAPSSLQSALHMDSAQSQLSQQSQPQQQSQQPQAPVRKRRKNEANNDDAAAPAEPRRLRRSHEACARCRSKKIKASPVG